MRQTFTLVPAPAKPRNPVAGALQRELQTLHLYCP